MENQNSESTEKMLKACKDFADSVLSRKEHSTKKKQFKITKETLVEFADYLFNNFSNVEVDSSKWRQGRYKLRLNDYAKYHKSEIVVDMFLKTKEPIKG